MVQLMLRRPDAELGQGVAVGVGSNDFGEALGQMRFLPGQDIADVLRYTQ